MRHVVLSRLTLAITATLVAVVIVFDTANAGREHAKQPYRHLFWHDQPDRSSLLSRALAMIGLPSETIGRSYALIAGVDTYPNMHLAGNLDAARADVNTLSYYLKTQEHFDEIIVLANKDFNIGNLSYFLEEYLPSRLRVRYKDRFLFTFSGHGNAILGIGHLLRADAESVKEVYKGVSLGVLRSMMYHVIRKAHHTLVLINACEPKGLIQVVFGSDELIPKHSGAHAIAAGGSDEKTWSDSRPGRTGSLFFEVFLDGLQGAADIYPQASPRRGPGDGIITLDELYTYVRQKVKQESSQLQNPRGGALAPNKQSGGFFFFNRQKQVATGVSAPWDPAKARAFGESKRRSVSPQPKTTALAPSTGCNEVTFADYSVVPPKYTVERLCQ